MRMTVLVLAATASPIVAVTVLDRQFSVITVKVDIRVILVICLLERRGYMVST